MTDPRAGAWYRDTVSWGQTTLTELDPTRYDGAWSRNHWRETRVQGAIVNVGGIVAYYPTALPFHARAQHLGDRDLFGEIVANARADGQTVIARMDSNRATPRRIWSIPTGSRSTRLASPTGPASSSSPASTASPTRST